MSHADRVIVYLTDNGPTRIVDLGKALKIGHQASTIARALEKAGRVKTSAEKRNFMVALPDQKLPDAGDAAPPPKGVKQKKGGKKGKGKKRRARFVRKGRGLAAAAAPRFLSSLTADNELVLNGLQAEPLVLSAEQTEKVATLILATFDK